MLNLNKTYQRAHGDIDVKIKYKQKIINILKKKLLNIEKSFFLKQYNKKIIDTHTTDKSDKCN